MPPTTNARHAFSAGTRGRRRLTFGGSLVGFLAIGALAAAPAFATAATKVTAVLSFAGSGTSLTVSTSVNFTSGYAGNYQVVYYIYRSTSSSKTSPVKVTATALSKSFSTTKGTAYTFGPNVQKCAAGTTAYYYWVSATVSDGSMSGTTTVLSTVSAATKACASI